MTKGFFSCIILSFNLPSPAVYTHVMSLVLRPESSAAGALYKTNKLKRLGLLDCRTSYMCGLLGKSEQNSEV